MTITAPPFRLPGPGRAGGSLAPDPCSRAARLDRVLRAITIGVLAPLTAWVLMRWFALPVDFHVYRYASVEALHGSDIYAGNITGQGIGRGGLPYTYTPFALLALLPTALFNWSTAYHLWGLAAVLAVAWAENAVVVRVIPLTSGTRRAAILACALTLTAASTMMINEISMGQVNSLLMLACLADLFRPRHGRLARLIPPGTLVGIATAIKLTPGLFICYFVVTRQWRLARNSALAAATCMIAGAAVYPAISEQFLTSVMWHLPHLIAFGNTFSSSGNNSVQGILAAIGPWTSPLRAPSSVAVAALGLWAARICHRMGHELEAWLVTGITAQLASPVSWTHHWIWLAPAVLLAALTARTRVQRTGTALAVVMLLIGSPFVGQYLLVHGPVWVLPVAVLKRECLVSSGIWCCAMFLIRAIQAAPNPAGPKAYRLLPEILGTIWGPHLPRATARRQRSRTSCTVHNVHSRAGCAEALDPLLLGVKGSRVQIPPSRLAASLFRILICCPGSQKGSQTLTRPPVPRGHAQRRLDAPTRAFTRPGPFCALTPFRHGQGVTTPKEHDGPGH
jgi:alpha-1,2-mannosyltransferase